MTKITQEIKGRWRTDPFQTGFMLAVLALALLTYLKPTSTQSIWGYLGLTALNFIIVALVLSVGWYILKNPRWKQKAHNFIKQWQ